MFGAGKKEIDDVRESVSKLELKISELRDGLLSQKRMMDIFLNHFNLEPITTIKIVGAECPSQTKETKLQKRKILGISRPNERGDE